MVFSAFPGKFRNNRDYPTEVQHPRVARTVRKCIELLGYELFQYVDQEGERHVIDSSDVNDYLKAISGDDVTAKDFRTWGGTVLAAETLYRIGPFTSMNVAKKTSFKLSKK